MARFQATDTLLMLLLSGLASSQRRPACEDSAMDNFGRDGVVPDVLDAQPKCRLDVHYPAPAGRFQPGQLLALEQVQDEPSYHYGQVANASALYSLIMLDPDVPSRADPSMGQLLHLFIRDIPGAAWRLGRLEADYVQPAPPAGVGPHRYVFVLCQQQPDSYQRDEQFDFSERTHFDLRRFLAKHKLGQPVAGNFFRTERPE